MFHQYPGKTGEEKDGEEAGSRHDLQGKNRHRQQRQNNRGKTALIDQNGSRGNAGQGTEPGDRCVASQLMQKVKDKAG